MRRSFSISILIGVLLLLALPAQAAKSKDLGAAEDSDEPPQVTCVTAIAQGAEVLPVDIARCHAHKDSALSDSPATMDAVLAVVPDRLPDPSESHEEVLGSWKFTQRSMATDILLVLLVSGAGIFAARTFMHTHKKRPRRHSPHNGSSL